MRRTHFAIALGATLAIVYFSSGISAEATEMTIYKNPGCMCCDGYADYLREHGFEVIVKPTHDLSAMSREAGIPDDFQGCHLGFVADYVVSGHVPISTVNRLLDERPDIKGLTLPGMPLGSPGMSGTKTEPFTIYEFGQSEPKIYATE